MKFANKPPLTVDTWESSISASIDESAYNYMSWFFFSGSVLNVTWSFDSSSARVYLIKSENGFDAFNEWMETEESSLLSPYILVDIPSSAQNLSFSMKEDDFYFIFFWNPADSVLKGNFNFSISSVYATSSFIFLILLIFIFFSIGYLM